MQEIVTQLLSWYAVVQLCTLAVLPLTVRLFANLPDRGYAFAKSLGIFLIGLIFWLGYSYGLLRNEAGGAWLALVLVGAVSFVAGSSLWRTRGEWRINWAYVLSVEGVFLLAFLAWSVVRMYDPAANHTEQPMDLMFMNGIWNSATYPPQDPWLAGYAISYYYFGYWLLTMLARLSGLSVEVAYNVGQACWFALLLTGCYGVVTNLLSVRAAETAADTTVETTAEVTGVVNQRVPFTAMIGGVLGALAVGVVGNLQSIFEFLVATGRDISGLVSWFDVYNFAENAAATDNWYIDFGWWWWRSSRVIEDISLSGGHIEVIDEFPMFSYILGDNHPHVMAMPFVLLVVAMAFNLLLHRPAVTVSNAAVGDAVDDAAGNDTGENDTGKKDTALGGLAFLPSASPLGLLGLAIAAAATGGLYFFNSWDFPPYWLLMMLAVLAAFALRRADGAAPKSATMHHDASVSTAETKSTGSNNQQLARAGSGLNAWVGALVWGGLIFFCMILLYLPYFVTAQSQAGGLVPNVFYPTKFRQFFLMFGLFLPAIIGLIWLAWRELAPSWMRLGVIAGLTYGLPILFLTVSTILGARTPTWERFLGVFVSPDGLFGNGGAVIGRRLEAPWTFLIVGLLFALVVALLWERLAAILAGASPTRSLIFVLLLAAVGLLLVFAPEFVYLRDNFGTRMNTIFKFYYQAWMLFGLCSAYVIMVAFRGRWGADGRASVPLMALSALSLVLILGCMIFPVAGVYSKTFGFGAATDALTLDATAHVTNSRPTERAAIEWVRENTGPTTRVLEGEGASYRAEYNMISTLTGRPTLVGWGGHESQWRGQAYGEMAAGRGDALNVVYRSGSASQIVDALAQWDVEFVYVGPTERAQYEITPRREEVFAQALDLAFTSGDVRIYGLRR